MGNAILKVHGFCNPSRPSSSPFGAAGDGIAVVSKTTIRIDIARRTAEEPGGFFVFNLSNG
jgi:hypothetical protein